MAFLDPMMFEIHVLLVDHDVNSLLEIANLLRVNFYKVTAVQNPSIALSMLSEGSTNFDLLMFDMNSSSNLQELKLFHDAVTMGLTVIMMSANGDPTSAKCAIQNGAFLFIQKPVTVDVFKYMWQHILREKIRKSKEVIVRNNKNYDQFTGEIWEDNVIQNITINEYGSSINNIACQEGLGIENNIYHELRKNVPAKGSKKRKIWMEWSQELHGKFMEAVRILGDGKCFPHEILELMNVPGLTRLQVASHLQKCRTGWKLPQERQPRRPKASRSSSSSADGQVQRSKPKKYGLFPHLVKGSQPKFSSQDNKKDEQSVPSTTTVESENLTPSSGIDQKMEKKGTLDITNSDNSINIDEIFNGTTEQGTFLVEQDIQGGNSHSDVTLDNFAADNLEDNFAADNLEDFDLDQVLAEVSNLITNEEADEGFWTSWMSSSGSKK